MSFIVFIVMLNEIRMVKNFVVGESFYKLLGGQLVQTVQMHLLI
jgi:hypothetical protein